MKSIGKTQLVFLAVFIILNAGLIIAAKPEATYREAADADQYIKPAIGLIQYGAIVDADTPDIPFTFKPPLYSIFLAIPLFLFPWKIALVAVVVIQLILLYATGLMTRGLIAPFLPRLKTLAQAFVIFNPNSLITAHFTQSETLFTFFLTATLYTVILFVHKVNWKLPILTGLLAGLTALTRPMGLYAIPLFPIAFGIFGIYKPTWMNGGRGFKSKKSLFWAGLLATLIACLTISPWFLRNYLKTKTFLFASCGGVYLNDQYMELVQIGNGWSLLKVCQHREKIVQKYLESHDIKNWADLTEIEQNRILLDIFDDEILAQPASSHVKALLHSWILLYLAGGASNFKNYLGWAGESLHAFLISEKWRGCKNTWTLFLRHQLGNRAYMYTILVMATLIIAIILRLLGLFGLVFLFRREQREYGLLFVGILLFFMAIYIYLGHSRYRVPMEPILAVFAASGWYVLRNFFGQVSQKSGHPNSNST
ncbi:MAG: hypothetical protein AB1797_05465 [bacterium]